MLDDLTPKEIKILIGKLDCPMSRNEEGVQIDFLKKQLVVLYKQQKNAKDLTRDEESKGEPTKNPDASIIALCDAYSRFRRLELLCELKDGFIVSFGYNHMVVSISDNGLQMCLEFITGKRTSEIFEF